MAHIPFPWHTSQSGDGPQAPRLTQEQYCTAWAQRHPVQALLAVAPLWSMYSSVAPSIALVRRSRTDGLRGYKIAALMTSTALRELRARRTGRAN